ncbi:serpin family protein [Streptomyces sp. NBC_01142]|uniref:serpin family protein n=1 Tax=Streptomyces sp. NBC_01142 TaxID=2975865 RepID=UPI0022591EA5|nr:serpin family protein [Streptomyces sp. NBC_01142]MCX4819139.1 serpin family protein [Streptomyces sp. NBC_01142]
MQPAAAAVRAVNHLTAQWARQDERPGGTVFSAAGVWPLLALLADGAGGAARRELGEAVGLPAAEAAGAARGLLAALGAMRGVDAALGLWTKKSLPLHEKWAAALPPGAHARLSGDEDTDRAALDAWAAERTGGQIEALPVVLDDETELVLASALALRTEWFRPFTEGVMCAGPGPWAARELSSLMRTTSLLDRVGVADTPTGAVTVAKVLGNTGIDVHLLLGEPESAPASVLATGIDVLAGRYTAVPADRLPYGAVGPGLTKSVVRALFPTPPRLHLTTSPFSLTADHDLLERDRLFGLAAARDRSHGHFPGVSPEPLAIRSARQSSTATFGALGFRAASVTALGAAGAGVPEFRYRAVEVDAVFDRPFGFLAVHRTSRLVLTAGWVAEPTPYRDED